MTIDDAARAMIGYHICTFSDNAIYTIVSAGRKYRFDFSDRFGPSLTRRGGRISNERTPKHFLRAVSMWRLQGKRVEDGMCVWHEPKQPVVAGGMVIEDGEEGWDW